MPADDAPHEAGPWVPRGSTAQPPFELMVTPERAGWQYAGLRVLDLPIGGRATFTTGDEEMLVLPLTGSCDVTCDDERVTLTGRASVFARISDFAYVPRAATVTVRAPNGGRFALPCARASRTLPFRYGAAEDVAIELRGAGQASRQVNSICMPPGFDADRLIVCEVLTPGGNWSSYPPHKHDEQRPGEARLEEIYYFEVAAAPTGTPGVGYQRVYGPIEVCAEVRSGDAVLVPYGWHGPTMAAPGYDLYHLNVMAGPGQRRWLACDDPAHAWVRASWTGRAVDPRLPLTSATPRRPGRGDPAW
ncbi:5-deoxy-glucuronate isomerase [Krasilnikovia sp. MM14-A1259]|uniref:5-deoxy-glucuronate isomerase n=1 Tax=Krasilnikovia sp. MM14-A1259 TaxID=3373539 RepID=UPI00380F7484